MVGEIRYFGIDSNVDIGLVWKDWFPDSTFSTEFNSKQKLLLRDVVNFLFI